MNGNKDLSIYNDSISIEVHQLKTPLVRNKWGLSYLLQHESHTLTNEQREIIQDLYESNEQAIALINKLLVDEREYIETDRLEIVDIVQILKKKVEEFSQDAKSKGVLCKIVYSPNIDTHVRVDIEKIGYVFENIIGDALQYSKKGGEIEIQFLNKGQNVCILISDDGIGIPSNEQHNIFNKFFRASNAQKTSEDGVGLGLHISKKIIESHNGSITFTSTEGEGTQFIITIPLYHTQQ